MRYLESEYGKYLYLPLDLPDCRPKDPEHFRDWWHWNSRLISKRKPDGTWWPDDFQAYRSINSRNHRHDPWEGCYVSSFEQEFPELVHALASLPYAQVPEYCLWQSTKAIGMHRDGHPMRDLPSAFRFLVYDENPMPTLFFADAPTLQPFPNHNSSGGVYHRNLRDTTAFAYNNIRCVHGSVHDEKYLKVLLIPQGGMFDFDKFETLLKRSIAKYSHLALITGNPATYYVDPQTGYEIRS